MGNTDLPSSTANVQTTPEGHVWMSSHDQLQFKTLLFCSVAHSLAWALTNVISEV